MQGEPGEKSTDYLDEYRLLQTLGEGYHATYSTLTQRASGPRR